MFPLSNLGGDSGVSRLSLVVLGEYETTSIGGRFPRGADKMLLPVRCIF